MVAHNAVDLTGQRFGFLVAQGRAGRHRKKYALWRCLCDCGQEVVVRSDRLTGRRKKSCGIAGHRWVPPGGGLPAKFKSEYRSWSSMFERCRNSKHKNYKRYGGRGILVCERWKTFAFFLEDMGPKPAPHYTIERIKNDLGYEKANCRWATRAEQSRNMRCSVYVDYNGQRMLLLDVVAQLGLSRSVVYGRLKSGWSLERALSTPVRAKRKKPP